MNQETKNCQNCKKDFTIETEDFRFYEKIKVPAPTFCAECRAQRRFVFRNEEILYKESVVFVTKKIYFTLYSNSDKQSSKCRRWYGDTWNAMEYARV